MNIVDLPEKVEVPRDQWGRPFVVPKAGGKPVAHVRTTTFIDCIEDKSNLMDWKVRMALYGHHLLTPEEQAEIILLDPADPEDKKRLNELAEKASDRAGANDKREKGTQLHELSELIDAGEALPESASDSDVADLEAYRTAVSDFEVVAMEQFVVCNELLVAGTFDRSLRYTGPGPLPGLEFENELLIGDLKTGGKPGPIVFGTLKMAMQLAIYSRGERYDFARFPVDVKDKKAFKEWKETSFPTVEAREAYTPIGGPNQQWGVIIHQPSGSGEATAYWADLSLGWQMANVALHLRAARKRKDALIPFRSVVREAVLSQ